jgi:hypothetical protein
MTRDVVCESIDVSAGTHGLEFVNFYMFLGA